MIFDHLTSTIDHSLYEQLIPYVGIPGMGGDPVADPGHWQVTWLITFPIWPGNSLGSHRQSGKQGDACIAYFTLASCSELYSDKWKDD